MPATYAGCGLEVVRPQTQSPRTKGMFLFLSSRSFFPQSEMNFAETIVGSFILSRPLISPILKSACVVH